MKKNNLFAFSSAKQLAFTALFATLCCLSTVCIAIPLPLGGYLNIGDVFVLLSAWCLGPTFGAAAAGIGSALADIILGYGVYAPATLLIKTLMAFIAYMVWSFLSNSKKKYAFMLSRAISACAGEVCMILGYFLFDSALVGSFVAAAPTLITNGIQGIFGAIFSTAVVCVFSRIQRINALFPALRKES